MNDILLAKLVYLLRREDTRAETTYSAAEGVQKRAALAYNPATLQYERMEQPILEAGTVNVGGTVETKAAVVVGTAPITRNANNQITKVESIPTNATTKTVYTFVRDGNGVLTDVQTTQVPV